MLDKRAMPNKIDQMVNYVDEVKKDYREYGLSIFDLILSELMYGA
jgi:hypothetical protein